MYLFQNLQRNQISDSRISLGVHQGGRRHGAFTYQYILITWL